MYLNRITLTNDSFSKIFNINLKKKTKYIKIYYYIYFIIIIRKIGNNIFSYEFFYNNKK